MWDLATLKKLNKDRTAYLQKKKAEKEAIKKSLEDLRSSKNSGR